MAAGVTTPLSAWFGAAADMAHARRAVRRHAFLAIARARGWRDLAPSLDTCVAMARAGLPFQIAAERRYDRTADPRRLGSALAAGKTVFLPQVHQVLPRLMRLIVALRVAFMGGGRDEASFLFIVEGIGRQGMGLHHDGEVDSFWLQLEGRRTVTLGPPVAPGTAEELPDAIPHLRHGWRVLDLPPGSLLYLPPRTPHEVVCYGRSLAISLTWARRRRAPSDARAALAWDVVSGHAAAPPPLRRGTLWTQAPALARRKKDCVEVLTAEGQRVRLGVATWPIARTLASMPSLRVRPTARRAIEPLVSAGILGCEELPLRLIPDDAAALDGWRFA